jgi:hypothetical protein
MDGKEQVPTATTNGVFCFNGIPENGGSEFYLTVRKDLKTNAKDTRFDDLDDGTSVIIDKEHPDAATRTTIEFGDNKIEMAGNEFVYWQEKVGINDTIRPWATTTRAITVSNQLIRYEANTSTGWVPYMELRTHFDKKELPDDYRLIVEAVRKVESKIFEPK